MNRKSTILILFLYVVLFNACQPDKNDISTINAISPNAPVIVQIHDAQELDQFVQHSEILKHSFEIERVDDIAKLLNNGLDITNISLDNIKDPVFAFINESGVGKYQWVFCTSTRSIDAFNGLNFSNEWQIEKRDYSSSQIIKATKSDFTFYAMEFEGIIAVSLNENLMEEVIRQIESGISLEDDEVFMKHLDIATNSDPFTILINMEKLPGLAKNALANSNPDWLSYFGTWVELDGFGNENALILNGASLNPDSSNTYLSCFKNIGATRMEAADIIPGHAVAVISFGTDNFMVYKRNFDDFLRKQNLFREIGKNRTSLKVNLEEEFYKYIDDEFGVIYTEPKNSVVQHKMAYIKLKKSDDAMQNMVGLSDGVVEDYREYPIYKLKKDNFLPYTLGRPFKGLKTPYFVLNGDWLIFSNDLLSLKTTINDWIANKTWSESSAYQSFANQFTSSSNIMLTLKNPGAFDLATAFMDEDEMKAAVNNTKALKYPDWAGFQLKNKGDATIISAYIGKQDEIAQDASQVWALQLDAPAATNPQFIYNHNSGKRDILVQDEMNNLYQIDSKGNILWKTPIEGRILGEVEQVDLYKNQKYQIAFTAGNNLYVIDRLGRNVEPFPVRLDSEASAPLAAFDYDKSRNYRFLVACGNRVFNYTKDGKKVSGWNFTQAESNISLKPKHYALGGKDYLIFAEDNGKVNILNRRGEDRINLKSKIHFNQEIYLQTGGSISETRLLATNSQGYLISLFFNDQKDSIDLDVDENLEYFSFDGSKMGVAGNNLFALKDINDPFEFETEGEITARPLIKNINDRQFYLVAGEEKVYLLNQSGEEYSGFPVYGNKFMNIGNFINNGIPHIITSSNDQTLYLYRVTQ